MHPQSDKTSDLESSLELYTNIEPSTTSNNENPRTLRDRRGSIYPTSFDTSLNILFGLTDIVLIMSAIIFAISIAVVLSVVALAMVRAFSLNEYSDLNFDQRFILKINE